MRITSKARLENGQKNTSSKRSFFASRWFIITGVLVLMFVVVAFSRELYRKTQLTNEIDRIAGEIDDLRIGNEELSALIDYYQTESYQELSAREHLGLTTRGEVVISIPNDQNTEAVEAEEVDYANDPETSNIDKWWNYFF
ncbi:septum formation initiator family protein [Patescibacteria group bacterium]